MTSLARTEREVRSAIREARGAHRRIGLVPTMGALHAGHLSLVEAARAHCDYVVVSIFVNPTQFGPHEDFDRYPRQLEEDCQRLEGRAELVFAPTVEVMYPPGFSTFVEPPQVAHRWEGECRPGHFRGVTTVVLKLFTLVQPDVAFFGEKDYQQLQVIRRMVVDLNFPIEIIGCPLIRDDDGVALSSRNQHLSGEERERARSLSAALFAARRAVAQGERNVERLVTQMMGMLRAAQVDRIDYVAIVDPESLEPVEQVDRPSQALIAAHVGSTRLIDNLRLDPCASGS
ncbi:MAG TPA: pantoate--beta-alanine ligase [Planctomycetaceae bacterium]|nr:pantoate--beta-alanine ligase [Planctomycetaceae bacterium]